MCSDRALRDKAFSFLTSPTTHQRIHITKSSAPGMVWGAFSGGVTDGNDSAESAADFITGGERRQGGGARGGQRRARVPLYQNVGSSVYRVAKKAADEVDDLIEVRV